MRDRFEILVGELAFCAWFALMILVRIVTPDRVLLKRLAREPLVAAAPLAEAVVGPAVLADVPMPRAGLDFIGGDAAVA